MSAFNPQGRTVLITGASSGIGRATAMAFAKAGAKVAVTGRNRDALEKIREEIVMRGSEASAFPFDLQDPARAKELVQAVEQKYGAVDILINNAGMAIGGLTEDCPLDEARKLFDVDFFAPLALIQAVLPGMQKRKSGQIINVGSGAGRRGLPGYSAYCAAKAALHGLTESLRLEARPYGIDIILVLPGGVASGFVQSTRFFGRWREKPSQGPSGSPSLAARLILNASRCRKRTASTFGPAEIAYHLNYWAPRLLDWLISKKYPTA